MLLPILTLVSSLCWLSGLHDNCAQGCAGLVLSVASPVVFVLLQLAHGLPLALEDSVMRLESPQARRRETTLNNPLGEIYVHVHAKLADVGEVLQVPSFQSQK